MPAIVWTIVRILIYAGSLLMGAGITAAANRLLEKIRERRRTRRPQKINSSASKK